MTKQTIGSFAAAGMGMAMLLMLPPNTAAQAGDTGSIPRALVLNDLGGYAFIADKMEIFGWDVTTISTLELIGGGSDALSDVDIVWIPASANYPALRRLVEDGSPVDEFAKSGGVVVIMGLSPDSEIWLDIAPGGADGEPLPDAGAGAVEIALEEHPMISGAGTGGVQLVPSDLDPDATGGRGNILNAPEGTHAVVIATNTAGAVIVDHHHGAGHIFISCLLNERDICRDNVLLYIQSIAGN